ncbi:hypothetical protein [Buttiauxella sp. B2]|uniref:hypothetical protein n=1 Tax=Buttiauxella sp. B2 TaxID=2587812 RepID=UPI001CB8B9F5|nr:hypothetical protein [Buttiauxella sp. B2]
MTSSCAASVMPDPVSVPALADLNKNRIADNKLREVTPTHATTGMGLAVLGALTGNINSGDFDKENYKGNTIDALTNPTDAWFTPKAKQNISQWLEANANGYAYKQPLYIGHATWALVYNDATAATPSYQLKYKVIFYKRPESGNMFSAFTVAECSPTPVEAKLSDWRMDNYARVTTETEKYMNSCLLELNNQLPRLLKK